VARPRSSDSVASRVLDLLSLSDGPDLALILERILRAARVAVEARYAALGVPDGRGGFARFITTGISEKRAALIGELPRVHGVLGALLDSGPIVLDDIRKHPRFSYFPEHHPVMTDFLGVPITNRGEVLGNIFLSGRSGGRFTAQDRHTVEVLARYAGVAIANADLYRDAHDLAVAEERARVARELHDAASQRLFSLVYEARAAAMRASSPDDAAAFAQLEQRAAETLHELRGLVFALRPKSLERDGLAVTLLDHVDALRRTHHLDISLEADDVDLGLSLDHEQELLRIAQEAMHNAVKHGGGAAVRVLLRRKGNTVTLTVRDQGPGFDPDALPRTVRSHGMATMQQRARALGSELSVRSAPGKGSVVSVRVAVHGAASR
jgi:signal transduction histidine kinase